LTFIRPFFFCIVPGTDHTLASHGERVSRLCVFPSGALCAAFTLAAIVDVEIHGRQP
jgi:hypothetical protein